MSWPCRSRVPGGLRRCGRPAGCAVLSCSLCMLMLVSVSRCLVAVPSAVCAQASAVVWTTPPRHAPFLHASKCCPSFSFFFLSPSVFHFDSELLFLSLSLSVASSFCKRHLPQPRALPADGGRRTSPWAPAGRSHLIPPSRPPSSPPFCFSPVHLRARGAVCLCGPSARPRLPNVTEVTT